VRRRSIVERRSLELCAIVLLISWMKASGASMFLGTPFWLARDWHVGRMVNAD
jgi:uncharacterized membrane protein